jgi:hypothetical protein
MKRLMQTFCKAYGHRNLQLLTFLLCSALLADTSLTGLGSVEPSKTSSAPTQGLASKPAQANNPLIIPSSVHSNRYVAYHAIDGDSSTRWASQAEGPAQLSLDFGRTLSIDNLEILWEVAFSPEYRIQTSLDGQQWTTVHHQKRGQGGREVLTQLGGQGRFLRIDCLRASPRWNLVSIWELRFRNPEILKVLKHMREGAPAGAIPPISLAEARATLAKHKVQEIVFATRADSNDGHWYANIGYFSYNDNAMLYGKGGRLCKLNVATGDLSILIDDPRGTVRDPVVHYDAQKILFSWRKAESRVFHLYECDLDGKHIKQITNGQYDDIEPCYLPDGGIVFVSGRGKRYVQCWLTQVAILYRCDADGSNIRQLSANVEHDNTPWVLPDGRILYQRWEYVDRSQVDYHHLWTMNPDGANQMIYFGNLHPSGLYIDAKPIPGSDDILFINSPGHGRREHSGHVAMVNNSLGPDQRDSLTNISQSADYRDPWPLSSELFIVAKGKKIMLMDQHGKETCVYTLPSSFGRAVNLQEPRPVIPRQRERVLSSHLDLTQTSGRLILQDVTMGRNMRGVNTGEIKKLLVLESLPKPINFTGGMDPLTYGGSFTMERILGTIPVEDDGSAYMELPANRALFFVALDQDNNSVKRMQSFLTVMPGETQSCVGCHESRNATPVNNLKQQSLLALKRAPSWPEPLKNIPDVFDFPRDIQPILDKHCVRCHDQEQRSGGIVLTGDRGPMFSHSYVTLTLKRQFADGRNLPKSNYPPRTLGASASPLMKKLNGAHHDVRLSAHEQDLIRFWIETGACYPGTYAALGHGAIGGYQQNQQINVDKSWPTGQRFTRIVQQKCLDCHQRKLQLPTPLHMSDEIGISFWRFSLDDKRFKFSRHLMFNLSRPEKSLFLLGPLAKNAGGLGLCKVAVFNDKRDHDYQALLAHISAGKEFLETKETRFDMPHFKPRPEYLREMKKYGVLPASFDPELESIDTYALDRKYWQSLWYQPQAISSH